MKAVSASRRRIDSPAAIRRLRNPRTLRFVGAFLEKPALLSVVSQRLRMPIASALRIANALLDCGVLRIDHVEQRAGRALKWYVATAPVLFVPYEAEGERLPGDVVRRIVEMRVEDQVRGLIAAAQATLDTSGIRSWGTLIYADRHGQLVVRPDFEGGRTPALLGPQSPAYLNFYSDDLRLTRADAKKLQIELVALVKKYKAGDGPHPYTLSAVLAPRIDRRYRDT